MNLKHHSKEADVPEIANESEKSPHVVIYQPDWTPNPEETPKDGASLKSVGGRRLAGNGDNTAQSAAKTQKDEPDQNGSGQRKKYVKKKITCFTEEMDQKLLELVRQFGESSWNRVSKILHKSEIKCHKRYLVLSDRQEMASASWSKEEDKKLTSLVLANGAKDWTKIANKLPGRIGKQCRERWHHHLNPNVIKKKWTLEEDTRIVRLYLKHKTRWSEIARHVEGRTDNQIKNRFNSNLKKRLQDPEFKNLEPAESSCEKDSEDSVTFDGNTTNVDTKHHYQSTAKYNLTSTKDATMLKNDEPTM